MGSARLPSHHPSNHHRIQHSLPVIAIPVIAKPASLITVPVSVKLAVSSLREWRAAVWPLSPPTTAAFAGPPFPLAIKTPLPISVSIPWIATLEIAVALSARRRRGTWASAWTDTVGS